MSVAGSKHFYLLVDEFVINGDFIVGHLVFSGQFDTELGSHSDIEYEFERSCAFEVLLHLLLRRHGLAKHLDIVFTDILIQ